ncbi:protein kinase [Streptomyces sp. NPDC006476]|uniref:serine/threonine-protein kinase n=1 Tax=Streptomyces sp. NPDC006476 TaxID=3157175 RepID=UPI0033AF76C6
MSSGERSDGGGRLLAGRYRVVGQLGRGGMGVVWRAVDEVLGREVAVKELRTYSDADGPELADLRLRMQREARAAARVRHHGVVAVHDIGEVDGRPLIVMELVDGPSLDDVLRERGTLDPREAAGIGAKVMDALAAAHRVGVLHRDVKPGNILLDRSGGVVLTDFGIATMEDPGDGNATHLTRSGELVGSLDYLAPERAQGAEPGPASDVWALGATLYAAVEGTSPFRRTSTYSTLAAIVSEPLPEPRRAGPLGPVLQRLLNKHPEARPEAEEARALLRAVADLTVPDIPTTTLRGGGVPAAPAGFGPAGSDRAERLGEAGAVVSGAGGRGEGVAGSSGTTPPGEAVGGASRAAASEAIRRGPSAPDPEVPAPGSGERPGPVFPVFGAPEPAGRPPDTAAQHPEPAEHAAPGFGPAEGYGGAPSGLHGPETTAPDFGGHGPTTPGGPGGTAPPGFRPPSTGLASAPTGPVSSSPPPHRKGRVLLAAVAVGVVLAAAGTTVALVNGSGGDRAGAGPATSSTSAPDSASASGRTDADHSGRHRRTEQGDEKTPTPTEDGGKKGGVPAGGGGASASAKPSGGGTTRASGSTGTPTAGSGHGGATTPAPSCTAIGGGKYDCTVWRDAKSYTASGAEAGVLHAGVNYFYCQQNLGRRETYGRWTNVWWARTDDDSGNTNVYVSDVYVRGGDNDQPVPGLPVC